MEGVPEPGQAEPDDDDMGQQLVLLTPPPPPPPQDMRLVLARADPLPVPLHMEIIPPGDLSHMTPIMKTIPGMRVDPSLPRTQERWTAERPVRRAFDGFLLGSDGYLASTVSPALWLHKGYTRPAPNAPPVNMGVNDLNREHLRSLWAQWLLTQATCVGKVSGAFVDVNFPMPEDFLTGMGDAEKDSKAEHAKLVSNFTMLQFVDIVYKLPHVLTADYIWIMTSRGDDARPPP